MTNGIYPTIATEELLSAHKEVYHYTTAGGCNGIANTNYLHATFYRDLNDTSELEGLKSRLVTIVAGQALKRLQNVQSGDKELALAIERAGSIEVASTNLARRFVTFLYENSFQRFEKSTYTETFVTSFCTHDPNSYEARNGLLSQWRGYGGDGGFCLVFDAASLATQLSRDADRKFYLVLGMRSVHYAQGDFDLTALFPRLVAACDSYVSTILGGENTEADIGIFEFLEAAASIKHRAFAEESELRIVAMPGTKKFLALERAQLENRSQGALIDVLSSAGPARKRHIRLLEGQETRLPINRLIVGPSRRQQENLAFAKALFGADIPIEQSETPFIG